MRRVLALLHVAATVAAVAATKIAADKANASPSQKVVKMLADLKDEVHREGKVEEKQFKRYADFCKLETEAKEYAIKKSTGTISRLKSSVGALGTETAKLDQDVSDLAAKIGAIEEELEADQAARDKEHATYQAEWQDMEDSIKALYYAIQELDEKKGNLKGSVSEALPQVKAVASKIVGAASHYSLLGVSADHLADLEAVALPKAGQAADYTYKSGSVVKMLRDLRRTFKENRYNLETEEMNSTSVFEKKKQSLLMEKKLAEKEKNAKTISSSDKKAKKAEDEGDWDDEVKVKAADEAFLQELTTDCQDKAAQFDQRSGERAKELKALAEAVQFLKEKLPGALLQATQHSAPSFLQLSRSPASKVGDALALLDKAAEKYGNQKFRVVALKIKALKTGDDPFAETKAQINGMIDDLNAATAEDDEQKGLCADEAAKNTQEVSDLNAKMNPAEEERLTAESKTIFEKLVELKQDIAKNKEALQQATAMRKKEKEENALSLAEAKEGLEACDFALGALQKYYGDAFLQLSKQSSAATGAKEEPAADSSGATLADKAPKFTVEDGDYSGNSGGNAVITAIQDLKADFGKDESAISSSETESESDYQKYKQATEEDTAAMESEEAAKTARREEVEVRLVEIQDEQADYKERLKNALVEQQHIQAKCHLDWVERKSTREAQIKSMQDVLATLDNM